MRHLNRQFTASWQRSLTGLNKTSESGSAPSSVDLFSTNVIRNYFSNDVTDGMLGALKDLDINQDGTAAEVAKTRIQRELYSQLLEKTETSFFRKYFFRGISFLFTALTMSQVLPSAPEKDDTHFEIFLIRNNFLFTNLLFATSTFLARVYTFRADQVERTAQVIESNYDQLDEYFKAAFTLGMAQKNQKIVLGKEFEQINQIVIDAWFQILQKRKVNSLGNFPNHDVTQVTINMYKALLSFYMSARRDVFHERLRLELVQKGVFKADHKPSNNELVEKARDTFSDTELSTMARKIRAMTLDKAEAQRIAQGLANQTLVNSQSIYGFYHTISYARRITLDMVSIPKLRDFILGISKVLNQKDRGSREQDANSRVAGSFTGISALQKNLSTFSAFRTLQRPNSLQSSQQDNTNLNYMLKIVGDGIHSRLGEKIPWYYGEALTSVGDMIGLPIFSYLSEHTPLFIFAQYTVSLGAIVAFYSLGKLANILYEYRDRFQLEYKEYKDNLVKLVEHNLVNTESSAGNILTDCKGKPNIKVAMYLIASTLHSLGKDNILKSFHRFSNKERTLIGMKLFNAFSQYLLEHQDVDLTKLSPECTNALIQNLAAHIEHNSELRVFNAFLNRNPAICHISAKFDDKEKILAIIDHTINDRSAHTSSHTESINRESSISTTEPAVQM